MNIFKTARFYDFINDRRDYNLYLIELILAKGMRVNYIAFSNICFEIERKKTQFIILDIF